MAGFDALARLEAAGAISGATPEQREVLATLSEEEVSTLLSIVQRLQAAEPDVQGHVEPFGPTVW